jgi:glucose-1-phosphate adenylyltransferase
VPRSDASEFGVISTAADGRTIAGFLEKPTDPPGLPDDPDQVFASMGNYVFSTDVLLDALRRDSADESSRHDMGGDIVPMLTEAGRAEVYDFRDNDVPGVSDRERGYWRDVGTLDAYYDAHMDLISVYPVFNLYNRDWPILTNPGILPPAKVVNGGSVPDSLISPVVIVSGSQVRASVLSPGVRVHDGSWVDGSVLAHGAVVGPGAVVRRAILDKNVVVGPGARVGVDHEQDLARGATISAGGITVYGKGLRIE